jgi:hypothetical protein
MTEKAYPDYEDPGASGTAYTAGDLMIDSALAEVNTATLVQVVAATNSGGLSPVGFVDVQPLVNQSDAAGHVVPHSVVHKLPYFRLQGGTNAVIIDPQPGDIGIAVFASRDISKVKNTKAQAAPGSSRMFSMSDGLYIGGVLNGTPSQYVQFSGSGVTITSPTVVTINAPSVSINGAVAINGASLTHNGTNVGSTHVHGGVSPGNSSTSGPQ